MRLVKLWESRFPWRDPDRLLSYAALPFIYTAGRRMFYGQLGDSHGATIVTTRELEDRYGHFLPDEFRKVFESAEDSSDEFGKWRDRVEAMDLLGRVSATKDLVSFWNQDPSLYANLLAPCYEQLRADDKITKDAVVSTPVHGTTSLAEALKANGKVANAASDSEVQLYRKLHLLRGDAKKAALKKLLGYTGSKPNKWQKAMLDAGIIGPGQKWWAPHSEGKRRPGSA